MEYKQRNSCRRIVIALVGCALAATVGGSLTINNDANIVSLEEKPCCRDTDPILARICVNRTTQGIYETVLNCTYTIAYVGSLKHYFVNSEGVLLDRHFSYETEYCTGWDEDAEDRPVVVVCFNYDAYASGWAFFVGKGAMLMISVSFLAGTLYVYYLIPGLRETQDKVTCIAVAYLMMFMLLLGSELPQEFDYFDCYRNYKANLSYFSMISYFAWLNVVMANVWKTTVAWQWKIKERTWYILNHIYALAVALTLIIIMNTHHVRGSALKQLSCWSGKKPGTCHFTYIPLTVMLVINIVLFMWITLHLRFGADDISQSREKTMRYKCLLYLKLFLLAGFTWILEIISFYIFSGSYNRFWFWLPIDSINCLHGVLIFLVLVWWRPRLRRELSGRRILCFRGPASWAQLQDDERDQLRDENDEYEAERTLS